MKLIATVFVIAALLLSATPGLALQPTPIDITGRVAASGPTINLFGIEFSLLTVRSGGMLYEMVCFPAECRQIPRGTPVIVHARLWSDAHPQKGNILTLEVFSVELR